MSVSPPIRRLSFSSPSKREEELINAYEAEEERVIHTLYRKLEQIKEDMINMERAHEEESESAVNRLSRELSALRLFQLQQQQQHSASSISNEQRPIAGPSNYANGHTAPTQKQMMYQPPNPSTEIILEALKRENEALRTRLTHSEREYVRLTRLNEIYRTELIEHRQRSGLSVDDLVGVTNSDPYAQPLHLKYRTVESASPSVVSSPRLSSATLPPLAGSSNEPGNVNGNANGHPSSSTHRNGNGIDGSVPMGMSIPMQRPTTTHSVPIPRPQTQNQRSLIAMNGHNREAVHVFNANQPHTFASISSASPSPSTFSPLLSAHTSSYPSHVHSYLSSSNHSDSTNLTTPPSSASPRNILAPAAGGPGAANGVGLSYPSVPPPSLSSSLGSPVLAYFPGRDRDRPGVGLSTGSSPVDSFMLNSTRSASRSRGSSISAGAGPSSRGRTAGNATSGRISTVSETLEDYESEGDGEIEEEEEEDGEDVGRLSGWASSSNGPSRRSSVERGARIAETGSLLRNSNAYWTVGGVSGGAYGNGNGNANGVASGSGSGNVSGSGRAVGRERAYSAASPRVIDEGTMEGID